MLTPEVQNEINEKWNASWPLCQLRPLAILDLVSYLFLVKKISNTLQAYNETEHVSSFTLTGANGKKEEITGDFFNDPEDKNIYALFADANGTTELEKAYSSHLIYGAFIKSSLLMQPTSKLLDTSLGIIKIIEDSDIGTKERIWSYLLNKAQYNDANGHAYLPKYLADLMVAIVRPSMSDIILNPTIGNGNLLVSCVKYLKENSGDGLRNTFDSDQLKGLESDGTSLRISAMNLVLNGITNPALKVMDIFSPLNSFVGEEATIILSNLIFLSGENNMNVDATALRDTLKKDIYYLDFILKNFRVGTRCAVIVPGRMLFSTANDVVHVRKEITDHLKLNALISIDDKDRPEFNGASILVFSKEASAVTDKIWFYKLKHGTATDEDDNLLKQTDAIATHFKSNGKSQDSGYGFYVEADEIRAKNYNFSFNEYIVPEKEQVSRQPIVTIKPGGFPKLGREVIDKSVSYLQPASAAPVEIKKAPPAKLPKQRKIFNKEAFNIEKKMPRVLLKKLPTKKMGFVAGLFILLAAIGYLFYSVLFSGKEVSHKNKTLAAASADPVSGDPGKATSLRSIDSVVNSMNSYLLKDSADKRVKSYTVISKAYFYNSPNIGNPVGKYLTSSGGGVLTSLKEENGFVYVNYINSKGRSTKGWLNKNDLEEAGTDAAEIVPVETKQKVAVEKKANDELTGPVNNATTKYLITTKAYFYSEPDINSRLDLYLNKPNHTRLSPLKEKNGFVYVVYRNARGKITRGWLNKKDLRIIQE